MLGGKPKIGKSWLALGLAVAVASGGVALGRIPVDPGDVLYLALEDTQRRLQSRLQAVLGEEPAPDTLHLVTSWPRMDNGGKEHLQSWLKQHPSTRLVIVDTLARIRSTTNAKSTLYDDDYHAIALLKRLADNAGAAFLVITHLRKMAADDPLDSISGTIGQTGAADCIHVLKRDRAHRDANLFVTGRDVEEQEFTLRWDPASATWGIAGKELSQERQEIIDLLRKDDSRYSPKEIAMALNRSEATTKTLVWRMANAGQLRRDSKGYYYVNPETLDTPDTLDTADTPDTEGYRVSRVTGVRG